MMLQNSRLARPEAPCDGDQTRVGGAHRGMGIDSERKHREQKDDEHPRAHAGADPDHDQRQERHLRRGIERGQERLDCVGEAAIPAGGKAQRDPDSDSASESERIAEPLQARSRQISPVTKNMR